jgi:nitrogen regulatory protein P-II 1
MKHNWIEVIKMKEIKAYIKTHKLSKVTRALHKVEGLTGMSVTEVRGFGRKKTESESYSPAEDLIDFVPHVKIEIVCLDELSSEIVSVIEKSTHTGLKGDGKIYVSDVSEAIRIQTGERGDAAV